MRKKGIYTYYKERLVEIGGGNKCLYLRNVSKRGAYDIGRIFEGRGKKVEEFTEFLWSTKRFPMTLISNKEKKEILENLDIQKRIGKRAVDTSKLVGEELHLASLQNEKVKREESSKAIQAEISLLKDIMRTAEEVEKETGRSELYIGYPFVFGALTQGPNKTVIKAPLLLFPVKINIVDENTCEISIDENRKIHINRALIFAYAQAKDIPTDQIELDYDNLSSLPSITSIIKYLESFNVTFDGSGYDAKNIYNFARFKEPDGKSPQLSLRYAAVLTRFPISNAIFNDYCLLEKKHLTNDAISELLLTDKKKKKAKNHAKPHRQQDTVNYTVKSLDYAQSEVVRKVDEEGNMVIWGPPGTGKSQTIVNIITDAISKKKKILVISQKKAALDVVYNRLGNLSEKAMYIVDETKQKKSFYQKCLDEHNHNMASSLVDIQNLEREYRELISKTKQELDKLDAIYSVLHTKRPFGLSLSEMYAKSKLISKNSQEYTIYASMIKQDDLMSLTYDELYEALSDINAKNFESVYYTYIQSRDKNPLISHLRYNVDMRTLSDALGTLTDLVKAKRGFFKTSDYPYYRQVLTYYYELEDDKKLADAVKLEYKFAKNRRGKKVTEAEINEQFVRTRRAIASFAAEYEFLRGILTDDGYLSVIDHILGGNMSYVKYAYDAVENYTSLRDTAKLIEGLDKNKLSILNFAYKTCKNYQSFTDIISKILEIRIYHEAIRYEDEYRDELAAIVDYDNITARISRYREAGLSLCSRICYAKSSKEYDTLYKNAENSKDYLYQISKKQKFWPIRKTMEIYGDFLLSLFPCWLLSPENVSGILPLVKNMFDLVIFDEASQVFIESTIPSIYRGKNIVVAGDAKQLRPSSTFMKRYLGVDPDTLDDYSVQAALEVESLLDLAVSRYESAHLNYHYRSRSQELINFSNSAFYSQRLKIAPNTSRNVSNAPIERYKVAGKWIDRKNTAEAKKVIDVLRRIFETRENNESIGIITFNSDQQACISDLIDKECAKDEAFRLAMYREKSRVDNGEDTSIFIKNLENVQGDERDIIIFSIAYAENELGRVYTNFGSLSAEGGENRLNVAITRAKTKIIVITSIEPEALRVEASKNDGPKLLQKYLAYVRAVAEENTEETKAILAEVQTKDTMARQYRPHNNAVKEEIKTRLEALGYTVELNLGNSNNRISLAVYDKDIDKYLVGVELDSDAALVSPSVLERDVLRPNFLEGRGWSIIRIWERDWWLHPSRVIKSITSSVERNRKKYC